MTLPPDGSGEDRSLAGRWIVIGLLGLLIASLTGAASARAEGLLVFAAASQRNALDRVIEAWSAAGGGTVKASYQSSSTLARQIEQGGPADIFISANPKWMDYLSERNLIDTASRSDLFGNGLVLVAARDGPAKETGINEGLDLVSLLGGGRLAVGDPDHVPAGIYAKQALQSLGAWDKVAPHLARAENVRAALALVSRGEAPYGIVYSSDAVADGGVKVVGRFPENSHAAIVYPAAVTAASTNAARAREFLAFLRSPAAVDIFQQHGFRVLGLATN